MAVSDERVGDAYAVEIAANKNRSPLTRALALDIIDLRAERDASRLALAEAEKVIERLIDPRGLGAVDAARAWLDARKAAR